ncbi:TPA: hypothetical protein ACH3X1_013205 [Trebouxia sp. C0004]
MPKSLADSNLNKPSCSNHSRYPEQACKLERPSNFQMHNIGRLPTGKYAARPLRVSNSLSEPQICQHFIPMMPSTRNGEEVQPEPAHRLPTVCPMDLKTPTRSRLRIVARSDI